MSEDEFWFLVLLVFIIYRVVKFIKGLIKTITYRVPDWHGKHGEEYLKWKKENEFNTKRANE